MPLCHPATAWVLFIDSLHAGVYLYRSGLEPMHVTQNRRYTIIMIVASTPSATVDLPRPTIMSHHATDFSLGRSYFPLKIL